MAKIIKHTKSFSLGLEAILSSNKFFYATIAIFLVQAIFFAITIKIGVPPDENYHIGFIKYLASNGLNPFMEQTSHFNLGDLEREVSYLYHLVMATLYSLLKFSGGFAIYVLRLVNISFGLASLFMLKKIGQQLKFSKLVVNFAVLAFSSILMFIFLSASINYDNLIILISMASFYSLVLLMQKFSIDRLITLSILALIGSLVKYSYLPLAGMFFLIGMFYSYSNRKQFLIFFNSLKKKKRKVKFLQLIILVILLLLTFERVGLNVKRYGAITPNCDAVHSVEDCRKSPLYNRNQMMAERKPSERIGLLEFVPRWATSNFSRTYGVFAHLRMHQPLYILTSIGLFLVLTQFAVLRKINPKKELPNSIIYMISLAYILVLVAVNYSLYLKYGRFGFAIQGRYAFLVLPTIYLTAFNYLKELLPKQFKYIFFFMVPIFIFAALPIFIITTDVSWYNNFFVDIIRRLNN